MGPTGGATRLTVAVQHRARDVRKIVPSRLCRPPKRGASTRSTPLSPEASLCLKVWRLRTRTRHDVRQALGRRMRN